MTGGEGRKPSAAPPARGTFRARLWEYLGQPDEETPERRRLLYAIIVLRLGLGSLLLLRGWEGTFTSSAASFATRLGEPSRWGLDGLAIDTVLFILGCTELGIGLLLIFGAFTRVSAVTGTILAALYVAFGQFGATARCPYPAQGCARTFFDNSVERSAWLLAGGGLLVLVCCGSPFLGADRALDKLEEEERDRAPAVLPRRAMMTPLFLRAGLVLALLLLAAYGSGLGARPDGAAVETAALPPAPSGLFLALLLILGFGWRIVVVLGVAYLTLGYTTALSTGQVSPPGPFWFVAPLTIATALFIAGPGVWRVEASTGRRERRANGAPGIGAGGPQHPSQER